MTNGEAEYQQARIEALVHRIQELEAENEALMRELDRHRRLLVTGFETIQVDG